MPKALYKLIEDISWDSKLSVNFTFLELIRKSLVDLIEKNSDFRPEYTFVDYGSSFNLDVNFKSLSDMYDNDQDENYKKRKKEIDNTLRELIAWIDQNK